MKIIAIVNIKGGVGKTTITHNLTGVLAERKRRVLLVDMDHQANLTTIYATNQPALLEENGGSIVRALTEGVALETVIRPTALPGVSIVPADFDLDMSGSRYANDLNAHFMLADLLEAQNAHFDYCLLDCPPNLGMGTRMALVAANAFLVPLEAHRLSFSGAKRLEAVVSDIRKRANKNLKFLGYVLNKVQARLTLTQDNIEQFRDRFGPDLLKTQIKLSTKFAETTTSGIPITQREPGSELAELFRELAKEIDL